MPAQRRAGRQTYLVVDEKQVHFPGMRYYKYILPHIGTLHTLKEVQKALDNRTKICRLDKVLNIWQEFDYDKRTFGDMKP